VGGEKGRGRREKEEGSTDVQVRESKKLFPEMRYREGDGDGMSLLERVCVPQSTHEMSNQ
jgi:hypothetical protein